MPVRRTIHSLSHPNAAKSSLVTTVSGTYDPVAATRTFATRPIRPRVVIGDGVSETEVIDSDMGLQRLQWIGESASVDDSNRKYSGKLFSLLDQGKLGRKSVALATLAVVAAISCAWSAYRGPSPAPGDVFRIVGASMAPTLWGDSRRTTCRVCDLTWRTDGAAMDFGVCWHCGHPVRVLDGRPSDHDDTNHSRPDSDRADLVEVRPIRMIERGQIVAFRRGGRASVKRVVAIPGDRVSLVGNMIHVNDHLIENNVRLPVDLDDHRARTRWSPDTRDEERHWTLRSHDTGTDPLWRIYAHASVYDDDRPSPVWDDYGANLGLVRPLEPVDRLILGGQVVTASDDAVLRVAVWNADQTDVKLIAGASFEVTPRPADDERPSLGVASSDEENPPLAPETPIAIRLVSGSAVIANLSIFRPILYRVRRRDDVLRYPMILAPDRFFVLGDNVPISIDSRSEPRSGATRSSAKLFDEASDRTCHGSREY